MNEADQKRKIVREINALPGGYAVRIEDRWRVGMLDLIIKLPTYPVLWAEGKVVGGNLFAPTLRQWQEGQRIQESGMLALLFGWKNDFMFISPWTKKANIQSCFFGSGPWVAVLQEYIKEESHG